ncbi:MAG: hypothetical protein Kow0025_08550 [Thermodesulfovibrionales bacterium]
MVKEGPRQGVRGLGPRDEGFHGLRRKGRPLGQQDLAFQGGYRVRQNQVHGIGRKGNLPTTPPAEGRPGRAPVYYYSCATDGVKAKMPTALGI